MPDIFDEVSDDLRAERAQTLLRQYGAVLVALMLLTLAGVGAWNWYQDKQEAAREAVAVQFMAAQKSAGVKLPPKSLGQQFAGIAATAPDGYRTLARLQMAAAAWNQGQHDQAIAAWQAVSDDSAAQPLLRDLATLISVEHQVDSGDAAALKAKLAPLVSGGTRWKPMAAQVTAMLDLRLGRVAEAKAIMKSLSADPQAPPGIRQMAQDLLLTLGDDGAGPHG